MDNQILDATEPITATDEHPYLKWFRYIAIGLEVFLWLFKLLAMLFKVESWPGSSELLIVSSGFLMLFYMLLTFLVVWAKGKSQILASILLLNIALLFLMGGRLFILESWEGGREVHLIGLLLVLISAVGAVFFGFKARSAQQSVRFHTNVLIRLILVFLLG